MKKLYHGNEDDDMIDDDDNELAPPGFYNALSSLWKPSFADPALCQQAFREAGIFPVDMSKNERAMVLKAKSQTTERCSSLGSDIDREVPELEEGDELDKEILEPQRVKELIDDHLSKLPARTSDGMPAADHRDYLLLQHARRLVIQQAEENACIKQYVAQLRKERGQEKEAGNAAPVSNVAETSRDEQAAASQVRALANKRTAPQAASPAKRRRTDAQCNVYGMV
jgi:hypothetical protein